MTSMLVMLDEPLLDGVGGSRCRGVGVGKTAEKKSRAKGAMGKNYASAFYYH